MPKLPAEKRREFSGVKGHRAGGVRPEVKEYIKRTGPREWALIRNCNEKRKAMAETGSAIRERPAKSGESSPTHHDPNIREGEVVVVPGASV